MSNPTRPSFTLALAAVVGLSPFACDMYLASLPTIAAEFQAPIWITQLTLTGYLLLLGIGQLFAGPISDAFGRRGTLLTGMAIFTAGCAIAAMAPDAAVLIASRALQGIGGAMALVAANSSVRDRSSGPEATQTYAVLLTVAAAAPVLSPSVGGMIEQFLGWRAVFGVLTVLGLVILLAAHRCLPESLTVGSREPLAFRATLSAYVSLFRSRGFVASAGALAMMFMALFTYIGGASYVYQERFDLGAATFGLVFGATGLALVVGPVLANRLTPAWGTKRVGLAGVLLVSGGAAVSTIAIFAGMPLPVVVGGMAVALVGVGASEPALMSLAMNATQSNLGAAAAILGASQYILGAAATAIAGVVAGAFPAGWAGLIVVFGLVAAALTALSSDEGGAEAVLAPEPETAVVS